MKAHRIRSNSCSLLFRHFFFFLPQKRGPSLKYSSVTSQLCELLNLPSLIFPLFEGKKKEQCGGGRPNDIRHAELQSRNESPHVSAQGRTEHFPLPFFEQGMALITLRDVGRNGTWPYHLPPHHKCWIFREQDLWAQVI